MNQYLGIRNEAGNINADLEKSFKDDTTISSHDSLHNTYKILQITPGMKT